MKDISALYDKALEDFKSQRSARVRRQVKNVLGLINLASTEKILEIGSATGKYTSIASKKNDVFCLDISLNNLKRAIKTVSELGNIKNLSCLNADVSNIPFAAAVFDKILAIDIVEHLKDEKFYLLCQEAHRVLKKGGALYIYTPNLLHPYELTRPFRPVLRKEHIGVRTKSALCKTLKENNFEIKMAYFNNFYRRISIAAVK